MMRSMIGRLRSMESNPPSFRQISPSVLIVVQSINSLMQEFDDRRVWLLGGREITRICLDCRFTIEICWREETSPENHVTIQISNPFVLHRRGERIEVNPEQIATVAPALHIFNQPVESLTAYRDGRLILRMTSGDEIVVEKDSQYESWETHGTGKLADVKMLCSPHDGPPWGGPR